MLNRGLRYRRELTTTLARGGTDSLSRQGTWCVDQDKSLPYDSFLQLAAVLGVALIAELGMDSASHGMMSLLSSYSR